MKSLLINTSTKTVIVSIIIDNEIKYLYQKDSDNDLDKSLLPIIDEAFKNTNISPNDLDTIYVTNGPGSFTGIRIGLTVAKIIAWGLKIKVVPISSLELMASTITDKENIVPIIDARRDYVFAGVYDKDLNQISEDKYILLEDLMKEYPLANSYYISSEEFNFDTHKPEYDILKVINKHKDDEGINPHQLNPNYLKKTEAEEKLEGGRK